MKWKTILTDELTRHEIKKREYMFFCFEGESPSFMSNAHLRRVEYANYIDAMIKYETWCIDKITEWFGLESDELDVAMSCHLCDTCAKEYPCCKAGVMLGFGAYSDNFIACSRYCEINKRHT